MTKKGSISYHLGPLLKLWPRGRLDISWRDLLFGALAPLLPGALPKRVWPTAKPHLAVHSVRTAWDALLSVQDWPSGSEIVFSEANIPDMVHIIEAHGLLPISVPLDPQTLQVEAGAIREVLTPRTKAILMSPLFGARMELSKLSSLAGEHGVLLVEDAAQAFGDANYQGAPEADVSLFSFGLIKTRTALSGGVVFVRDTELLKKLERHVHTYPRVSTKQFYARWGRAALLQMLSNSVAFNLFWRALEYRGINPDIWLSQATKGMTGANLLMAVRKQPHRGTVKLLRRRLHDPSTQSVQQRIARGRESLDVLPTLLGQEARDSVFWALPVVLEQREAFTEWVRQKGFDVSFRASSLICHGPKTTPFSRALIKAVFLPIGTPMPSREWTRLLEIMKSWQAQNPSLDDRHEPVDERG